MIEKTLCNMTNDWLKVKRFRNLIKDMFKKNEVEVYEIMDYSSGIFFYTDKGNFKISARVSGVEIEND